MKEQNKKILVLGASSRIGRYFWDRIAPEEVVGTYLSHPLGNAVQFDIASDSIEIAIGDLHKFSDAIILVGETNTDVCAKNKTRSEKVNVQAMKRLIDTLVKNSVFIVFASSEFVFNGDGHNWKETDRPVPIQTYSKQKFYIEQYLAQATNRYVITRFGKVYGTIPHDGSLFTAWIDQMLRKEQISVATDQIFSPIWVEDLVTGVLLLIDRRVTGIYHVAGPRGFSRKELFEMTLDKMKKKVRITPRVVYKSIDDFNLVERRPHNVTLSINKLVKTIGFTPRGPQEVIDIILKNYNL